MFVGRASGDAPTLVFGRASREPLLLRYLVTPQPKKNEATDRRPVSCITHQQINYA
jgi:hypothetical protein